MHKTFLIGLFILAIVALTVMFLFPKLMLTVYIVSAVIVLIWSNYYMYKTETESTGTEESLESFDVKFLKEHNNENLN